MHALGVHSFVNVGLNLAAVLTAVTTLFLPFFAVGEYVFSLSELSHTLQFEDVQGEVSVTYSHFESFACSKSQSHEIQLVCDELPGFHIAGRLYFFLVLVLIVSLISAILDLVIVIILDRKVETQMQVCHYVNCPIACISVGAYLALSSPAGKDPLSGVVVLCLLVALTIGTLAHYLYVLYLARVWRASEKQGTKADLSQLSVEDLRRELEAKTEALAIAQSKAAEQAVNQRAAKDQSAEAQVLVRENQNLERRLAALQADVEEGLSGDEKALFHRLSEAERARRELDRQLLELKIENTRLRDATEPSMAELLRSKERKIEELEAQRDSEIVAQHSVAKKGAGVDEQREVLFQDTTIADLEKEKADLTSKTQRLEESQQKLADENAELAQGLSVEQHTVKALRTQVAALQEQLQAALVKLGVQQDVDEVRGLLEESRRKELDDMKSIYEQRYTAMLEDQRLLRSELDRVRSDSGKFEVAAVESRKKKEEVESQVRTLEEDVGALRKHLASAEQQSRETSSLQLRTEFDLKKKAAELEILREQIKAMEDTHAKAIAELTNSRGDQLEAIKKLYAEAGQKDFNDRLAVYTARIERLQGDLEAERLARERSDARCSALELETRAKAKKISELTEQIASQSTQMEELLIKLAHIQTLQKQATDESAALKRSLLEKTEQLQALEEAQDDIQRANSKVLRDQESRHEKEVDRMKELYEVSQAKEMDELKKFYEQKIGKIHGDLVNERQERLQAIDQADKVVRDREQLEQHISKLQEQVDRQKAKLTDAEARFSEEVQTLQSNRLTLEQTIATLRSEQVAMKAAAVPPEAHQELQDRLASVMASLRDKEAVIKELQRTIEDLENGANVPTAIKEEVRVLRDNAEKTSQELVAVRRELAAKDQEAQRLSALQTQNEVARTELEAQLKVLQVQKGEADKQWKTVRDKLERKRLRLIKAREQVQLGAADRDKQVQDLTESYKLEKEKLKQTYIDIFQQDLEDIKQRYENKIATLNAELKTHQTENLSQIGRVAELSTERARLQKANKDQAEDLAQQQKQLEDSSRKWGELKVQYEALQAEHENLKSLVESLKKARGDQQGAVVESLEAQVAELSKANKLHTAAADSARKEVEELRNEVRQKEGELQNVKEECMALHNELLELKDRRPRSKSSTSMSRDDRRSGMTPDSSQSVKEIMIIDGMSGPERDSNPILEKVSKLKKEAPMTYTNVWKFFENLMQEKCKLDRLEMSLGRQPRTMTEFMLDFVYLHYGLKTLALKQLQALVTSLQELYKAGHPYGILFCRFIGVFHPRPLPHHLAVYLLVVGEEFNSLIDRNRPRRSEKFAEQYDLLQYGGQASVIDLMELIVKICKGNREAGERIISQLLPDSENRIEVILFKVCGTMARMGKDPKYIFEILDLDQGGAVDYHELVDGIRLKLNIWVTQDEAVDLCGFIDEAGNGQITLEDWSAKVSFADYMDRSVGVGMVTKANFLNALITEYEYSVVQDYYTLRHMIKRSYMDQDVIEDFLMQVDPGLDEKDLAKYYEEVLQYESDPRGGISPEAACIVVLKNRIGGFGVGIFGKRQTDLDSLDQTLPKSPTEGVNLDLVVERDSKGLPIVDVKRRTVS